MNPNPRSFPRRRGGRMLFILPAVLLIGAALAAVVMLLWNWLMPVLFRLPRVSYLQALGLLALCRVLVGGFGGRKAGNGHYSMRHRMREKWTAMSDEERRTFREEWRRRCGRP